jgi:hypothetical protein
VSITREFLNSPLLVAYLGLHFGRCSTLETALTRTVLSEISSYNMTVCSGMLLRVASYKLTDISEVLCFLVFPLHSLNSRFYLSFPTRLFARLSLVSPSIGSLTLSSPLSSLHPRPIVQPNFDHISPALIYFSRFRCRLTHGPDDGDSTSETSVGFNKTTRRNTPEDTHYSCTVGCGLVDCYKVQ